MDPILATHAALTILTPYLVKGGEGLASTMAKDLWEKFKSIFSSNGDEKALVELVTSPENPKSVAAVEYVVEKELSRNAALLDEIVSILKKYPQNNIQSNVSQSGNENIAVANTTNSSISINHK